MNSTTIPSILFLGLAATTLFLSPGAAAVPSSVFQEGLCDCDPIIEGEAADGDDVTVNTEDAGSFDSTGTATLHNQSETPGLCFLGELPCNTEAAACIWNVSMTVSVTSAASGDPPPASFKVGPYSTFFTGSGYPYTATSSTERYDTLQCEMQKGVTIRIKSSAGDILSTASFRLICKDCPQAGA